VHTNKIGYKHVWEVWYIQRTFPYSKQAELEWKALSGILRLTGLSMVRFQPDHDMRGVTSLPNVRRPVILV